MRKLSVAFLGLCVFAVIFTGGCSFRKGAMPEPNLKIVGQVTDEETGTPIGGARVADHLYGGSTTRPCQETWTDVEGRFVLNTWYEEHALVVSAPGYPPKISSLLTKAFEKESQVEMNFTVKKAATQASSAQKSEP